MIKRERYVEEVRPFYESDLIKIITGIRRSGKSIILNQIVDEVRQRTDNILYLNFEDKRVRMLIPDGDALIRHVDSLENGKKIYLFFDEIQNLEGWADACKTLRLGNASIFITGSNSKLLSREFTTEFSGRYVSFRVRPFVYREVVEYAAELKKEVSIYDYIVWGGFPKRFEFDTPEAQYRYLDDLDEAIVYNDLIKRYRIKKVELFNCFVNFVLRSNSRILSTSSIYNAVKQQYPACSLNTISKYFGFLEEAYIVERVKQYSTKAKKELCFYNKIYFSDVAFNSLRCLNNRFDLTHNFENIVYNELLYMGYEVYVYNNDGKEIDFLATKEGKQFFVQAAYSVADDKAYEREMSAFKGVDGFSQKVLITNDETDYSTSAVRHIRFKDFIFMDSL